MIWANNSTQNMHRRSLHSGKFVLFVVNICVSLFRRLYELLINLQLNTLQLLVVFAKGGIMSSSQLHGYSLITYSDLNQQQIDSRYNCMVTLITGNTVK